jgi:hypothetical protein
MIKITTWTHDQGRPFDIHTLINKKKKKEKWGGVRHLQRKSIRSLPSDNLPVDLWKNVRPLGRLTGKPSPATSPPVSELESPKLKIIGGFLHWEATEVKNNGRRRRRRKWERGWERSGEWEIIASEVRKEHKVKTKAAFKLFGFFTI